MDPIINNSSPNLNVTSEIPELPAEIIFHICNYAIQNQQCIRKNICGLEQTLYRVSKQWYAIALECKKIWVNTNDISPLTYNCNTADTGISCTITEKLKSANLPYADLNNDHMNLLADTCTDLESLTFSNNETLTKVNLSAFSKLKRLSIQLKSAIQFVLKSPFEHLTILKFDGPNVINLLRFTPNLLELTADVMAFIDVTEAIHSFPQIQVIDLKDKEKGTNDVIGFDLDRFSSLTSFTIRASSYSLAFRCTKISQLTTLTLKNVQFHSEKNFFNVLSKTTNLRHLSLCENFSNPLFEAIYPLSQLESLTIGAVEYPIAQSVGSPVLHLDRLPMLRILNLNYETLLDIQTASQLPNLQVFKIYAVGGETSDESISNIISNAPNLTELTLKKVELDLQKLGCILNLQQLQFLNIYTLKNIDHFKLSQLKNLRRLKVEAISIGEETLKEIPSLSLLQDLHIIGPGAPWDIYYKIKNMHLHYFNLAGDCDDHTPENSWDSYSYSGSESDNENEMNTD